jgi:hypothetical protein
MGRGLLNLRVTNICDWANYEFTNRHSGRFPVGYYIINSLLQTKQKTFASKLW